MTRLGLDADGLIASHEDIWSLADLIAGLPLLGRVYRGAQQVAGRLFSMSMNGFYAWRGGVSIKQANLSTNTLHAIYHPIQSQQRKIIDETQTDVAASEKFGSQQQQQQQHPSGSNKKAEQKRQPSEQKARK